MKKKRIVEPPRTNDADRQAVLARLGADVLAAKLVELAPFYPEVDEAIERLICPPDRRVERFRQRLANLSCVNDFVYWQARDAFVRELRNLLEDLRTSGADGQTGFECMVEFFDTEDTILGNCDDDGSVCEVFLVDAIELMAFFGARCDDKGWMCDELLRLYGNDQYCVRRNLFERATEYLPAVSLRALVARIESELERESRDYQRTQWTSAIESLTRQLNAKTKG